MTRLELRDFRLVDAVTRWGTLTRAGRELHVTQSGLSHQLADLEARLGARVFERLGRRLVLTPVGERLRQTAASVLGSLARAEEDLRAALADRIGVIRLATECYTCYHWLPPLLVQFQERFPRVETRIVAEATRHPLAALLEGQLDLALTSEEVADRRLERTPVFRDEMVAVVPPTHPWARKRWIAPEDFADQHLIGYRLMPGESTLYREVLAPAGVVPRRLSSLELTEAILELVIAGLGVAVMARWAVTRQLEAGSLIAVRVGETGLRRTWHAVVRRAKEQPEYLTAFVRLLVSAGRRGSASRVPSLAVAS